MSEYYGAPTTPTEDFLAHYGIKGMKWGVRKAIQSGSDRALARQYRKAERKLKKLEKLGSNGKKYAKRAAAYGAGAAAAGGVAAAGTKGIGRLVGGTGTVMQEAGYGASRLAGKYIKNGKVRNAIKAAGKAVGTAGTTVKGAQGSINRWGNTKTAIGESAANSKMRKSMADLANKYDRLASDSSASLGVREANKLSADAARKVANTPHGLSKNNLVRIGAGALGAGLGVAAARNAYRAATTKKHAQQAKQFRAEMNKAFAGTKYANGRPASSTEKKRRRRG